MTSPSPEISAQTGFDEAEKQIFASMSELLKRAGLEYQGRFVEVEGKRVHYLDYGEGEPVLLLHGGGAGSAIWFRQIAALATDKRVIVPDHPVFGLSEQVAYEAPFLDSSVRYMTGFMDAVGVGTADVLGLSLGAQMAMATAIDHPERIGRLAVIGSAGLGKEFPLIYLLANLPVFGGLIVRPNRLGQDTYFRTMEVLDDSFDDAGAYKQYAYDVTLMEGHAGAMRKSIGSVVDFGGQKSIFSDEDLSRIGSSTLAIWGEYDQVFPVEHGYRLAEHVPNSQLHVVENARHVPLLDHPDTVDELMMGFLA